MSADNWSECPICKMKRVNSLKELQQKYGKVSSQEYERLRDELDANAPENDEKETVREDYELGVSDEGLCYIIYSGVCQNCGASWQFDKRDILPEDEEDKKLVLKNKGK